MDELHVPVLSKEVVEFLNIKADGRYVDGTLGMGGHTREILKRLSPAGRILCLDVDAISLRMAKDRLQPLEDQTITRQVNFRGLQGVLDEMGWNEVDGMVFDLGVSSFQLADEKRGMSFQSEAPLDMRLDTSRGESALSMLRKMDEESLAQLLYKFGMGKGVRKLSRYLLEDVSKGKLQTARDLSGLCERVLGRHGKTHPATQLFLALRCLVNDELGALEELMKIAPDYLGRGGRMAVITFHSLEDRIVKQNFRTLAKAGMDSPSAGPKYFSLMTKKPVVASAEEVDMNPRARSAKLRVLERVE